MKALQFNPSVYRIETVGTDGNTYQWDLLTVDGETPKDTVYFMLKEDAPSYAQSDLIQEDIEDECWEEMSLEESGHDIEDFSIDTSIFDTAGEGYEGIRKELQNI